MDDRNVLGPIEKAEMRGLVLAGAARADSIRRRRSRIAASVSAVVVVAGIAVGAGFASGALGRGSVVPADPGPSTSTSEATPQAPDGTHPFGDIAAFDRPATEADALPDLPDYMSDEIKVETARYVGNYDDVDFWIVQGERTNSVCIVFVFPNREDWMSSCGGLSPSSFYVGGSRPGVVEAQLGPAGYAPEGWIELDENLRVNPNP